VLDLDETLVHASTRIFDRDFDYKLSVADDTGKVMKVFGPDLAEGVPAAAPQRVPRRPEQVLRTHTVHGFPRLLRRPHPEHHRPARYSPMKQGSTSAIGCTATT
jgi:hypothetical protein